VHNDSVGCQLVVGLGEEAGWVQGSPRRCHLLGAYQRGPIAGRYYNERAPK